MSPRQQFSGLILVVVVALSAIQSSTAFSLLPAARSPGTQAITESSLQEPRSLGTSLARRTTRQSSCLYNALSEEDDEDDEDDDEYIDDVSLGDWRSFRRSLAMTASDTEVESSSADAAAASTAVSVSKENVELLATQNEELHEEYKSGVWAHETSTPEIGGLVARMPLEMELYRNHKHSIMGRRLHKQLDGESAEMGVWYARAKRMIEDEMKRIATKADDQGQIDATRLGDDWSELLTLFLDNQETWQEICLVLEQGSGKAKTLVLNRPMAFKLTENLGKLVLNGAFTKKGKDSKMVEKRDIMRFMMAFSSECAVYVGGPDDQGEAAIMIHGIKDLPGAEEINTGTNIYRGGVDAAIDGVLEGKYSPLEFRFFVGCHKYEESALDVAVRLGKYQPIACARSVALKQCISLPKPLWHEVLELCGGSMNDLSTLELMKRDDLQFEVVDESEYDDDDDEVEIADELDELDSFDDDDDDVYL